MAELDISINGWIIFANGGMDLKKLMRVMLLAFAIVLILPAASSGQPDQEAGKVGSTIEFHSSENYSNQSLNDTTFNASAGAGAYGQRSRSPVNLGSLFGRDTWIKNQRSGASMSNEVSGAHSLDGEMAVSAVDSNSWDYYGHSGISNMQMKVNEDVTDGKVHIGALQGPAQDIWDSVIPPSATAIKDPKLEIDEDYIGTYHIVRNMTMSMPYGNFLAYQDWLPCCSQGYFDGQSIDPIDADRIFG
ncbi:MAG TPA: hypothetical protein VN455_09820 [Methanotrichaceae archaeon]|nr:hypothetical protein [Methanotrichaceae archaeon]